MDERGSRHQVIQVPTGVLERLLSLLPPGSETELGEAGHLTGVSLAEAIRESAGTRSPSWSTVGDVWAGFGLGRLSRTGSDPGLMEFVVEDPGLPLAAPDFVRGMLEGLLEGLASEPVGVVIMPEAGVHSPLRFVAGAPDLIARIRPGLESGLSIRDLMEEVWN